MTIIAAADGSALGNPGPAGWAWYVDDHCWRAGGWPHGTNNQGELMAVLDLFRSTAHIPDEDLRILCDSQYVINCITKWMPGWKRKGWRKADGKPVLNVDLLKDIDRAIVGRKYTFEWVKGHAGHDLNEAADDRARAVATAYQQGTLAPSGPGFGDAVQATRDDSRTPELAKSPALEPELFSESAGFSEPDLFSELAEQDFNSSPASDEEQVLALERELLRPEVRADIGRTGVLLHPDFIEIGSSGRIWTRDAMMMTLETDPGESIELEPIAAEKLNKDTMLLTYRSYARSGSVLRSSVWLREGGHWRLRFHQGTPEK